MKNYILTGAPGSGKTVLIRYLESNGYNVIDEAATDIIHLAQANGNAAPWTQPDFIEKVVQLQIQRRQNASGKTSRYRFFDRSPLCTLALARYLGFAPPQILLDAIDSEKKDTYYESNVFFIGNLGYTVKTDVRTLTFEEALRFEKIHEETYLEHGARLIKIPGQAVEERAKMIIQFLSQ